MEVFEYLQSNPKRAHTSSRDSLGRPGATQAQMYTEARLSDSWKSCFSKGFLQYVWTLAHGGMASIAACMSSPQG